MLSTFLCVAFWFERVSVSLSLRQQKKLSKPLNEIKIRSYPTPEKVSETITNNLKKKKLAKRDPTRLASRVRLGKGRLSTANYKGQKRFQLSLSSMCDPENDGCWSRGGLLHGANTKIHRGLFWNLVSIQVITEAQLQMAMWVGDTLGGINSKTFFFSLKSAGDPPSVWNAARVDSFVSVGIFSCSRTRTTGRNEGR